MQKRDEPLPILRFSAGGSRSDFSSARIGADQRFLCNRDHKAAKKCVGKPRRLEASLAEPQRLRPGKNQNRVQPFVRERIIKDSYVYSATCHQRFSSFRNSICES
jgi:hypothetical protein